MKKIKEFLKRHGKLIDQGSTWVALAIVLIYFFLKEIGAW